MTRALLVVLALLLTPAAAQAETLDAADAQRLAEQGELTLIDVRLPMEWARTGLPEGAVGVSLQNPRTLEPRRAFVADVLRAVDDQRGRPIALICATGQRSAYAVDLLERSGFTQVRHVAEGMIGSRDGPGWLARALPTEPCRVC